MLVQKRDGSKVDYDKLKIVIAVKAAYKACHYEECEEKAFKIANIVDEQLKDLKETTVEAIQNLVVEALMKEDMNVAKRYRDYRTEHAKNRNYFNMKFLNNKKEFISDYLKAENAAAGSKYDANANVSNKNIATMSAELNKYENIQINRSLLYDKITELYGSDLADEYIQMLNNHELYCHDETSIFPYCVSISMYPFLFNGLTTLGGESSAPKHISSFCGSFCNLVFAISSQFAGAVATVEFLMYLDYFIRKEYGNDYYLHPETIVTQNCLENFTIEQKIEGYLQQVVYTINQPAAARGYQSCFWNISVFDKPYFESIFGEFKFPDGNSPIWESLDWLQRKFLKWFNNERTKSILTFPVVTMALLTDGNEPVYKPYFDLAAEELSEGQSFFMYMSESADSLASCCRLRNELVDNTFSYSLGAGGVSTGSINVMTLNLNRLVQEGKDIREIVKKVQKFQISYRRIIEGFLEANMLPVYNAGYISLDKQFLTIGVNGMVEAAESQGILARPTEEYHNFVNSILTPIYEENKNIKKETGCMFNTEFVPGENLGSKNYNWDLRDGFIVPKNRECYNSYFYAVEDDELNPFDKFKLHGKKYVERLDGGSAYHLNLAEHLSKDQYKQLLRVAAKEGCNYWTVNVRNTVCNDCGFISKSTYGKCPKCGSTNVDYATRVIGYLKRVSKFSLPRQKEEHQRVYSKLEK